MTSEQQAREKIRVGARIRSLREEHGLTQRQLAEKVGCSRSHITNIERGHSQVTARLHLDIADLFGVTVDLLDRAS